jgi:hypothetical protein
VSENRLPLNPRVKLQSWEGPPPISEE